MRQRSVTPNNRLQRTARRAAAEPERYTAIKTVFTAPEITGL